MVRFWKSEFISCIYLIECFNCIIKELCKREKIEGKGEEQILKLQKHFPGFLDMVQNHKDSQYSPVDTSLLRRWCNVLGERAAKILTKRGLGTLLKTMIRNASKSNRENITSLLERLKATPWKSWILKSFLRKLPILHYIKL